jgi:hypothetical protein
MQKSNIPLRPGQYNIYLYIGYYLQKSDLIENACYFTVHETKKRKSSKAGLISVPHEWYEILDKDIVHHNIAK